MKYDPNNKLAIGTRVVLTRYFGGSNSFNKGIDIGDIGTVVENDIFEYCYVLKMEKDVDSPRQCVYSTEIELAPLPEDYIIPMDWERLSIL